MGSSRLAARILSMRRSRNCLIVEGNRHKRRTAELGKRDIVTSHCGDGNTRIGQSSRHCKGYFVVIAADTRAAGTKRKGVEEALGGKLSHSSRRVGYGSINLFGALEGLRRDQDSGPDSHGVVNSYHVGRAHPNTSIAGGDADIALLRGAMDVNKSPARVSILWFETFEPKDACDNGVAPGRVHGKNFSREAPRFEDSSRRSICSDLFANSQSSGWRGVAV